MTDSDDCIIISLRRFVTYDISALKIYLLTYLVVIVIRYQASTVMD